MTQIESLWSELLTTQEPPIYRRVDESHPLDLYAGIETEGERVLMLVTDIEPPISPVFEAIEVRHSLRADGRWVLLIRLKKPDLIVPFSHLCQDLIDSTRSDCGAVSPPEYLVRRLTRWRRLMELSYAGLSDAEARGLIGELFILESLLIPKYGATPSLLAWGGPYGAAQDFKIAGKLIEVKTCQLGSSQVAISSLEQLDGGGEPVCLAVVRMSISSDQNSTAFTLNGLVDRIRLSLSTEVALEELNVRLAEIGFDENDKSAAIHYQVDKIQAYRVIDGFPRIVRAQVPAPVTTVRYLVDISRCRNFEMELGAI
jgi:hypothetical protein